MKTSPLALLISILLLTITEAGFAACGAPIKKPTPQDYFEQATVVFIGEVQKVEKLELKFPVKNNVRVEPNPYDVIVTFKVTKFYKGMRGAPVILKVRTTFDEECAEPITAWQNEKVGTAWVVYAHLSVHMSSELRLYARNSSPSSRVAEAKNLKFLETNLANHK